MRMLQRFWVQSVRVFVLVAATLAAGRVLAAPGEPIKAPELAARIEAGKAPVILDVRSTDEFAKGHIPGAVNVPFNKLADELAGLKLPTSDEIVVHCEHGGRAAKAEAVLREAGYTNARDLTGHMDEWRSGGFPVK
jgi:rhodanese-related sulfurtransferase